MSISKFKSILLSATLLLTLVPALAQEKEPGLNAKTLKGLKMRGIGPALMSGRIADLAIHPQDQSTWYVAVGSGGVWRTNNAGTTWKPIFDEQGSYSIGCVTIDANHPEIIWVGTGENVGGRHVGYGDGIYRSLDGGETWENLGLKESEHIGMIVVDPRDSQTVYVAAQGPLWSAGGDRGIFKTTDGGKTWTKILGGGEYTGGNEVHMDPRDPDMLYAVTHQRYRNTAALINGGPESGIHKSLDGGKTWRQLKTGLPKQDMGKIGLAISPQNPDVVYATIELTRQKGGFYRSANGGGSWKKTSDYFSGGTGPHYYQEIFASPHQFDRIYQMDPRMHWSNDGGKTFVQVGEANKHGDNHALAFDPNDPNYLLSGSDGGLYESWDLGKSWKFISNLPVTQFYKLAVDYDEPFYNIYGGTQDNSTEGGPSRTDNISGIRTSDWFITLFADGHQPAVDYTNPDIIYSEWQQGNLVRYDRKTGEIVYIQPQPEPGDPAERWNWDSPILISPHNPATLYYASQRLWRSDDRGDSWRAISKDLSRGQDRLSMPMMGRVWSIDAAWDLDAMSYFGNITSVDESPLVEGLIYTGTDDGLIQVTEDGGKNWRKIDVGDMPGIAKTSFVNNLRADLHDADTVYAVLDNHKTGDFKPYIMKSTNRGKKWTAITGNLPERLIVWRLAQDHVKPELIFAGTEMGVYFTIDGGGQWTKLTGGVPNIPFRDLAIQKRENDLVGATFGRGFYILDDYTPLRHITPEILSGGEQLFPVRDAWWYIPKRPLGRGGKGTQGADYFTAPNPPFGAVFTYYLSEELRTKASQRKQDEKKLKKAGEDTPYPGWDVLKEEAVEPKPEILFTVKDSSGTVVRQLNGPTKAGFHRVAWDLRYPAKQAWRRGAGGGGFFRNPQGWLTTPGAYSVTLSKRLGGKETQIGEAQTFQVKQMRKGTLEGTGAEEAASFLLQVGELQRAVSGARATLGATAERVAAIQKVLRRSTLVDAGLNAELDGLVRQIYDLREAFDGNQQHQKMGEPKAPGINGRMFVVEMGNQNSTYGPTPTHRRSYEIALEQLAAARKTLNTIVETTLPAIEKKLEAAGVPWTPGRSVPGK